MAKEKNTEELEEQAIDLDPQAAAEIPDAEGGDGDEGQPPAQGIFAFVELGDEGPDEVETDPDALIEEESDADADYADDAKDYQAMRRREEAAMVAMSRSQRRQEARLESARNAKKAGLTSDRLTSESVRQQQRTARATLDEAYATLELAMRRNRIIGNMEVISVLTEDDTVFAKCASKYDGANNIHILIPFNDFFDADGPVKPAPNLLELITGNLDQTKFQNPAEMRRELNTRQTQFLARALGATISIMITRITKAGTVRRVYASRKAALQRQRQYTYNIGPRCRRVPVEKGMDIEGTIISVSDQSQSVVVSAFGVDMILHPRDLTSKNIQNMSDLFDLGQKIKMRVVDITRNDAGEVQSLRLSARAIETEEMQAATAQKVKVNELCFGTVQEKLTGRSGKPPIYRVLLASGVLATATQSNVITDNFAKPLEVGAKVCFSVKRILDSGAVVGVITRTVV